MKKMNKKITVLALATFILITGTSAYASGAVSFLSPKNINSENQAQVKKVEERLTQSWTRGREIILKNEGAKAFANSSDNNKDQDLLNWTLLDITKLHDELLSSFSKQEQSSFLEAFYGEDRKENLEVGDYMPALLISPDKKRALVYWEKANGSYVVLEMKTKSDDSNYWYVNGVKIL
ncbi:hypothetical protein [Paenibacillus caui]|uniref:hypothetical protein n=1 Tax=Paenibacillus caui TaxID=2873927 RepID=UPI001CA863F3|nr:hypothetical protein [Paenibacillus caui]